MFPLYNSFLTADPLTVLVIFYMTDDWIRLSGLRMQGLGYSETFSDMEISGAAGRAAVETVSTFERPSPEIL